MKVIFTSNRFIDFLIRLLITAIVISPVIIWSWDTVKETTADGMLAAAFVILYSGVLLFILYFCFCFLQPALHMYKFTIFLIFFFLMHMQVPIQNLFRA